MVSAAWLVVLATSAVAQVSGAPVSQLHLLPGGNTTCPWKVHFTSGDRDGVEHDLCAQQLTVSFTAPGKNAWPTVPQGYELLSSGNYYKVHSQRRRWHDARTACEREGAHLVVLETAGEADAVRKYLNWIRNDSFYVSTLHAGFRSKLSTVTGKILSYERWQEGQPYSYMCGQINTDAWLRYGSCTDTYEFMCEYGTRDISDVHQVPPVTTSPVASAGSESSPKTQLLTEKGYAPLSGWSGIYIKNYGEGNKSWELANETCSNDGGFLPVVESVDMAEALIDYVNAADIYDFYLGVKAGDPITVLGEELARTKYQRWESENPTETVCLYANNKLLYGAAQCSDDGYPKTTLCLVNVNII